jgi:hypothetical protein
VKENGIGPFMWDTHCLPWLLIICFIKREISQFFELKEFQKFGPFFFLVIVIINNVNEQNQLTVCRWLSTGCNSFAGSNAWPPTISAVEQPNCKALRSSAHLNMVKYMKVRKFHLCPHNFGGKQFGKMAFALLAIN